jgi:hypothetical protein
VVFSSIPHRFSLEDKDIRDELSKYGVKEAVRRVNGRNEVRMVMVDIKSWLSVCTTGIKLRNKHCLCSEWEYRPKKCNKCKCIGHFEDECKDEEVCNSCGDLKHINDCKNKKYYCPACKNTGLHTNEKYNLCPAYINKKKEVNKKYLKLLELGKVEKARYNIRSTNNENVVIQEPNKLDQESFDRYFESSTKFKNISEEIKLIKDNNSNCEAKLHNLDTVVTDLKKSVEYGKKRSRRTEKKIDLLLNKYDIQYDENESEESDGEKRYKENK